MAGEHDRHVARQPLDELTATTFPLGAEHRLEAGVDIVEQRHALYLSSGLAPVAIAFPPMRWPFLATLLLLGCPAPIEPTVGAPCTAESVGRCDSEAPRLLQCTGGNYVTYADCKGPNGCTVTSDTADCDTSGNSVGDRCAPASEGKVRCDPDGGVRILRCIDGGLESIYTCPQPKICGLSDGGLTCL